MPAVYLLYRIIEALFSNSFEPPRGFGPTQKMWKEEWKQRQGEERPFAYIN